MKNIFNRIMINQKIMFLSQVMIFPTIIVLVIFLYIINMFIDTESKIFIENISSIRAAYNLEISLLSLKGQKANYILTRQKKWLSDFDKNVKTFNYWYNEAFVSAKTDYEKNILSNIALDFEKYIKTHTEVIKLVTKNEKSRAIELLLRNTTNNYNGIINGCKNLIKKNDELISTAESKIKRLTQIGEILSYSVIAVFIILGALLAINISNSISKPINEIIDSDDLLAVKPKDSREIVKLKLHFNDMIKTINENQKKLISSEKKAFIGQVAAGISHELNNPIGIICGLLEELQKKKYYKKQDAEFINLINTEALRCKKLLGEMLDFARYPNPVPALTDVKKLITNNIKLISNQDKFNAIKFSVNLPKEPCKVYCDNMQMSQVLINLILNSCEALKYKGKVEIELVKNKKEAVITISDYGCGIKEDDIEKIFLPFYSTKKSGVGLGLAICRDIIEKHNGKIEVISRLNEGTMFTINLPRGKNG